MPLSRPTELRQFLDSLGVKAKKSLSQNFLIDGNILRKIIQEAGVQKGDLVLEIGAGPGALTECLLEAGARVVAVEKDALFAAELQRFPGLEVYAGDIREFPLEKYFGNSDQKVKVVANLPYHLTTPILALLIPRFHLFSTLTLMVQEEVARRMTATPNSSEYSSLTVFLNFYSKTRYAFKVSNTCFYPAPKVHSAIVSLELCEPPQVPSEDFFHMVRTAFGQRRKMLRSTLRALYSSPQIEEAFKYVGLSSQTRPENLSLEQFLALFRKFQSITHLT